MEKEYDLVSLGDTTPIISDIIPFIERQRMSVFKTENIDDVGTVVGASIICYTIAPSGDLFFVLGKENDILDNIYNHNRWCGFGGSSKETEIPEETAAREFLEETLIATWLTANTTHEKTLLCNSDTLHTSEILRESFTSLYQKIYNMLIKKQYKCAINMCVNYGAPNNIPKRNHITYVLKIPWNPEIIQDFQTKIDGYLRLYYSIDHFNVLNNSLCSFLPMMSMMFCKAYNSKYIDPNNDGSNNVEKASILLLRKINNESLMRLLSLEINDFIEIINNRFEQKSDNIRDNIHTVSLYMTTTLVYNINGQTFVIEEEDSSKNNKLHSDNIFVNIDTNNNNTKRKITQDFWSLFQEEEKTLFLEETYAILDEIKLDISFIARKEILEVLQNTLKAWDNVYHRCISVVKQYGLDACGPIKQTSDATNTTWQDWNVLVKKNKYNTKVLIQQQQQLPNSSPDNKQIMVNNIGVSKKFLEKKSIDLWGWNKLNETVLADGVIGKEYLRTSFLPTLVVILKHFESLINK